MCVCVWVKMDEQKGVLLRGLLHQSIMSPIDMCTACSRTCLEAFAADAHVLEVDPTDGERQADGLSAALIRLVGGFSRSSLVDFAFTTRRACQRREATHACARTFMSK